MSLNILPVSIGEIVTSNTENDVLVAYGLGSCVAISLYDPIKKVGGMLHALLPTAPANSSTVNNRAKFVDQGLPTLLYEVMSLGANRIHLKVSVCGGAQVLQGAGFNNVLNIGERNAQIAETILKRDGLRIQAKDTGGNAGRTVKLRITDGQLTVKTLGQGEKVLT